MFPDILSAKHRLAVLGLSGFVFGVTLALGVRDSIEAPAASSARVWGFIAFLLVVFAVLRSVSLDKISTGTDPKAVGRWVILAIYSKWFFGAAFLAGCVRAGWLLVRLGP